MRESSTNLILQSGDRFGIKNLFKIETVVDELRPPKEVSLLPEPRQRTNSDKRIC